MDVTRNSGLDPVSHRLRVNAQQSSDLRNRQKLSVFHLVSLTESNGRLVGADVASGRGGRPIDAQS
jgi:hypothetical protein